MEREGMEVFLGCAQAACYCLLVADMWLLWQWPFDDPYRESMDDARKGTGNDSESW